MSENIGKFLKTDSTVDESLKSASSVDFIKVKKRIGSICESFIIESKNYEPENTIKLISDYLITGERILYSEVSNNIFAYYDYDFGNFLSNAECFILYIYNEEKDPELRKVCIKLYDHCQLAMLQKKNLKTDEVYFQGMISSHLSPVSEQMHKEIYGQLISLVGIFSALSFLIFGGISSLDNIFQNLVDVPLLKLIILGCTWGIFVINTIFVFMYFVAKLTRTSIKTNEISGANFIQRYPFTAFANLMIGTVLAIAGWLYFIDERNIGYWFVELSQKYQSAICIMGLILIVVSFFGALKYLIHKCRERAYS